MTQLRGGKLGESRFGDEIGKSVLDIVTLIIFIRQIGMVSGLLAMFFSKSENMGWRHKFGSCQHTTSHEILLTREWL